MKQIFYLTLLSLLLGSGVMHAQLQLRLEPVSANMTVGEERNFNLVVESGFQNIVGVQFTITFDHSRLEFVEAYPLVDTMIMGQFEGMAMNYIPPPGLPTQGQGIALSWVDDELKGQSLAPGTALATVRLRAKSAGSSMLRVTCDTDKYICEVVHENGNLINLVTQPATINVLGSGNNLTVTAGAITAGAGSTACVPVTVNNFMDVSVMGFGMNWETNILTFSHLQNCNPVLGLDCNPPFPNSSFGVFADNLLVSWFSLNSATLPNGSILFEVCFDVAGNLGQTDFITFDPDPEFRNDDGDLIPVNTIGGSVTIGNVRNVILDIADRNVCAEDTFCVPIHVDKFTDIVGIQTFLTYDPAKATLVDIKGCNPKLGYAACGLGTFDFQLTNDTLTMLFIDPSPMFDGVTLDSGEVMINVCFENLMAEGDSMEIKFLTSKDPNVSEALDVDGEIGLIQRNGWVKTIQCDCNLAVGATLITKVTCPGGNNGAINLIVSGGSGNFTYTWNPVLPNTKNPTGLTAGTYRVTITDNTIPNCSWTSNNINVSQPDVFMLTPTVVHETCVGTMDGSITLGITGGTGPFQVNWGGGLTGNPIMNLSGGSYTPTITDFAGCTFAGTAITVNSTSINPVPLVTQISCFGANNGAINLQLDPVGGPYTVTWMPQTAGSGQSISNLPPGTYFPTVLSAGGCEVQLEGIQIFQPDQIVATPNIVNVVCNGEATGSITLNVSGGVSPYDYNWPGNITTKDRANLTAGSYPLTITDDSGCTRAFSFSVVNSNPAITVSGTTTPAVSGMDNGGIVLTVGGGLSPYTYLWSPNGATTKDLTGVAAGSYTVVVTDANGCTKSHTIVVNAVGEENIFFVKSEYDGFNTSCDGACDGTLVALPPSSAVLPLSYKWGASAGGSTNAALFDLCKGMYSVTITDANNKVFTGSTTLSGPPPWSINAQSAGEPPVASAFVSVNGVFQQPYEFLWSTGETSDVISELDAGTYCVSVTNGRGCTKTACVEIFDMDCLLSREVITPNGDNHNDVLIITCVQDERYMNNELNIFNRWGQLVYSTMNYANDWGGISQGGNDLPEDVYFFVLEYETQLGEKEILKGSFNILR
jgi:gliding motility-associated-like protein